MEILSKYLDATSVKQGDIVVFLDEGSAGEIKQKDGTTKKVYNFNVETNGHQYIYTPSNKALTTLLKFWGRDTKNWIGKKFGINIVKMEVAGKEMDVIRPVILEVKA